MTRQRLELAEDDVYYFDAAAADRAVRFIETYLCHYEDRYAGKPFILLDWQRQTVRDLFGWKRRADDLRAELSRRNVHPDVLAFCRAELLQQNYFHAVLEASKSVADKLRRRANLTGDGSPLVDAACSLSSGPVIRFNSLSTEWERSEQTGIATLMKGLFSTFRNPAAHAPKVAWATSRSDALDMLTLASMLHRRLDEADAR